MHPARAREARDEPRRRGRHAPAAAGHVRGRPEEGGARVREARRCRSRSSALVDTNCDPDQADYVDPGQRRRDPLRATVRRSRRSPTRVSDGRQQGPRGASSQRRGRARGRRRPSGGRRAAAAAPTRPPPSRGAPPPASRHRELRTTPRREAADGYRPTPPSASRGQAGLASSAERRPGWTASGALAETGGDIDAAVKLLRERGIAKAGKLAGRGTSEGVVDAYVHGNGRIGVLVEVGCNTDFVANTDDSASSPTRSRCRSARARTPVDQPRRRARGAKRGRARDLPGPGRRQAREHPRPDRRRASSTSGSRGLPARAAVHPRRRQ